MPSELAVKVLEKIFGEESNKIDGNLFNSTQNKESTGSKNNNRVNFSNLIENNQDRNPETPSNYRTRVTKRLSLEDLSRL